MKSHKTKTILKKISFTKIGVVGLALLTITPISLGCSPALPGSLPAPKDFLEYSTRSENALAKSQNEHKEVEKLLSESRALLDEMKGILSQVEEKRHDCQKALSESKSKLKAAEAEKRRAQSVLAEAKAFKEKAIEVATPVPTPSVPTHSSSDAP